MSHQKAALSLITELYTPQKMLAHESLRKIFHWYTRFDIFVGIIAGKATQMGREWFLSQHDFYKQQCKDHPEVLAWKYEERFAWVRLTGFDMRQLMAKRTEGRISIEEFQRQLDVFDNIIRTLVLDLDPALVDPSKRILDISEGRPKDPDNIVDPFAPNLIYGGEHFDTNVLVHDLLGFELMYLTQLGMISGKADHAGMRDVCLRMCQIYEGSMLYSKKPHGAIFGMQAGLALSTLFLHPGDQETWWARRKLAEIEANG